MSGRERENAAPQTLYYERKLTMDTTIGVSENLILIIQDNECGSSIPVPSLPPISSLICGQRQHHEGHESYIVVVVVVVVGIHFIFL